MPELIHDYTVVLTEKAAPKDLPPRHSVRHVTASNPTKAALDAHRDLKSSQGPKWASVEIIAVFQGVQKNLLGV